MVAFEEIVEVSYHYHLLVTIRKVVQLFPKIYKKALLEQKVDVFPNHQIDLTCEGDVV